MNQISLITELYYKQQQNLLLKEVAGYRLADEAIEARRINGDVISKFLVWVGKQLHYLGVALEERNHEQIIAANSRYQESKQGNCA